MTIASNIPVVSSTQVADGTNRTWTFPFRILSSDQVRLRITFADASVVYRKVPDITVTGVGGYNGGSAVYPISGAALVAGTTVVAELDVDFSQPYSIGT